MGLLQQLRDVLLLRRLKNRLREERAMGHGKAAVFGLATAILTAVVAKFSEVCPELVANWPAFLTAAVMGAIGVYLKSPLTGGGGGGKQVPR